MTRARQHVMGGLFLVSGVCFVAGVVNPPLLRTWGDSVPQGVAVAAAHRTAWFTSTWLITLSIAAAVAAIELLTRVLDSDAARVGRSLYLIGAALGLASTAYDLAVTSTLLGTAVLPGWYLGTARWAAGLGTAYFALLAPAALTAFGIAIFRTRALPRWTGAMFLAAALLLFAQYANAWAYDADGIVFGLSTRDPAYTARLMASMAFWTRIIAAPRRNRRPRIPAFRAAPPSARP
jgi:hypothetical protein